VSRSKDVQAATPSTGRKRPPSKRVDPPGAWITAAAIGVVFLLFYIEARDLPADIQRWPMWLILAGAILLALYALQQVALRREWGVIQKLDQLEETGEGEEGTSSVADALAGRPRGAEAEVADAVEPVGADEDRDAGQYGSAEDYTRRGDLQTALAMGSFVLFAAVAYGFGFLPATILYIPAYMVANGERHVGKLVALSLGTATAVYLLFGYVLNAPLTRGEWFRTDWLIDWIPL
jgi:hypothetical protein